MKKISFRRLLPALLTLVMLALMITPAGADEERAGKSTEEKAEALYSMGLFKGKGTAPDGKADFALGDRANRSEAATMLIRLLGREGKASAQYGAGAISNPFNDVQGWAQANVSWLYEEKYMNGTGSDTFGGSDTITAKQFAAMVLRSLGYLESKGDFKYSEALDFAVEKGVLTAVQREEWENDFRRGGMAEMCYNALYLNMRASELTLLDKLTNDGVFKNTDLSVASSAPLTLTLKYAGGGKIDRWSIEEPVSSGPVCGDVDGDGRCEIIFTLRSVYCLDAESGELEWFAPSGHDVTEGLTEMNIYGSDYTYFGVPYVSPELADVDGDGRQEIITFHNSKDSTFVGIYDGSGKFKHSFTAKNKAFAAKAVDLNGDGRCEIALGAGVGASMEPSVALYDLDGNMLSGWPKVCGYGMYSDAFEQADLDGDGVKELVLLYDEEHVEAFHLDGSEVIASGGIYAGFAWGGLPVCESIEHEYDLARWAARTDNGRASATSDLIIGDTRERRNCLMGTYGGVKADDMDGDGKTELVFTAMFLDGGLVMRETPDTFDGIARYFAPFILNTDRTRYTNPEKGFDWTQIPTDSGEIIAMGSSTITRPEVAPVTADLDGDGNKEIIFSSHDGKVHCFSLDGTEHGAWPYSLNSRSGGETVTFATMPAAADLNGDGKSEVVFATYTESDQTEHRGRLYVLDHSGRKLADTLLPPWWGYTGEGDVYYADGCKAQPCVVDVDNDGRPEIVITTLSSGVCVYEIN